MTKKINIDDINLHLVEAIEMLKNSSDPDASACEKIDVEAARTIAELGKVVVEGLKAKVQVLGILAKADNPTAIQNIAYGAGFPEVKALTSGSSAAESENS
jgi:hypothetical protein